MSFSSELKEELSKISNHKNECCKLAELAGYLITNCNVVKENGEFIIHKGKKVHIKIILK